MSARQSCKDHLWVDPRPDLEMADIVARGGAGSGTERGKRGIFGPPMPSFIKDGLSRWAILYGTLTSVYTMWWCQRQGGYYALILLALPTGISLGALLWVTNKTVQQLHERWLTGLPALIRGFLLFFFWLIGYISILSLMVSYPLGWFIKQYWGEPDLAGEYGLACANLAVFLAIAAWLTSMKALRSPASVSR